MNMRITSNNNNQGTILLGLIYMLSRMTDDCFFFIMCTYVFKVYRKLSSLLSPNGGRGMAICRLLLSYEAQRAIVNEVMKYDYAHYLYNSGLLGTIDSTNVIYENSNVD